MSCFRVQRFIRYFVLIFFSTLGFTNLISSTSDTSISFNHARQQRSSLVSPPLSPRRSVPRPITFRFRSLVTPTRRSTGSHPPLSDPPRNFGGDLQGGMRASGR